MFGMSIRKFIILSALIVSGCISHPETIAIDFDSGTEDYTPLVRKILAEHPAGEVTIRFGAGTFDFYPEQAAGSYLCVSNNAALFCSRRCDVYGSKGLEKKPS